MSVCANCEKQGSKAAEAFTFTERVQICAATASMLRSFELNPNSATQDKVIANSVVTKILLSFPEPGRGIFLQQLRQSAGIDVTLKDCPHGLSIVS